MIFKKTVCLVVVTLATVAINPANAASLASPAPISIANTQGKVAGGILDGVLEGVGGFIKDNFDRVRAETIGRGFEQYFVGELPESQLAQIQADRGGDWPAVVTDWCNSMVAAQRDDANIPYITSTWRIENGNANCYRREPNFPQ